MIPKVIHYCWFGGKPLPKSALRCIASWKKHLPGYEIREWNESNFDVDAVRYTREAYDARKYAFVSDYARFWVIYNFGGIYFDTDVEVLRPMDDILAKGPYMGREAGSVLKNVCGQGGDGLAVNPGLGMAAPAGMRIFKELLDGYGERPFVNEDGSLNTKTVVAYTSEILLKYGLSDCNDIPQEVEGIRVYPSDYFCPADHTKACIRTLTQNTRSIHHYDASWTGRKHLMHALRLLKRCVVRITG